MIQENSKAIKRRYNDGMFHSKFYVGKGIDIGCGKDSLRRYKHAFSGIKSVDNWDLPQGDAQKMEKVPDKHYDFATSSHCLEHMRDLNEAISNWVRILRVGGYLIVAVPDFEMYEHKCWPSRFNGDHKHFFEPANFLQLFTKRKDLCIIKFNRVEEFWDKKDPGDRIDTPIAEVSLELVARRVQ